MDKNDSIKVVVVISANIEWKTIRLQYPEVSIHHSPYGEWFYQTLEIPTNEDRDSHQGTDEFVTQRGIQSIHKIKVVFFHGGWGKISAAASAQYIINRWSPDLLVNLGTCGGFQGEIERGTIILVEKTIVYDLIEQMADHDETISHYMTKIDLSWLGSDLPHDVCRSLLVSGDRDLVADDIPQLKAEYGAIAGDWESGAIAFVSARNNQRLLILRGVTDLVSEQGGEAYGNIQLFEKATGVILNRLVSALPDWIRISSVSLSNGSCHLNPSD
jgi:adenosylhomocysteine nucleosidase